MAAIRFAYRYRDKLSTEDRWQKHYAVVVGLATAKSVVVLASSSRNATAIISAGAKQATPAVPAEIDASMSVSCSKDSVEKLWLAPALDYAFQALRLKPSMLKRWDDEDFRFVKSSRAAGGRIGSVGPLREDGKPRRPRSYSEWADEAGLILPRSDYEGVRPPKVESRTSAASDRSAPRARRRSPSKATKRGRE
jgi:hypothetical protein